MQSNYHLHTELLNLGPEIKNNQAVVCVKKDSDNSRQKVLRWWNKGKGSWNERGEFGEKKVPVALGASCTGASLRLCRNKRS